jgi:hypothetical protein
VSCELIHYPEVDDKVRILDPSKVDFEKLIVLWSDRYKHATSSPILSLRREEFSFFKDSITAIYFDNTLIGISKHISGSIEANPFSVVQSSHINLFSEEHRLNPEVIRSVAKAYSNYMNKNGAKRGSITLDYDTPPDVLDGTCFSSTGDARCLSASVRYIPSLMSNNTLSFADMIARRLR